MDKVKKLILKMQNRTRSSIRGERERKGLIAASILRLASDERIFPGVNCAAINENLLESELFGHEKDHLLRGRRKKGLFEIANNGPFSRRDRRADMRYKRTAARSEERRFARVGGSRDRGRVRVLARQIETC